MENPNKVNVLIDRFHKDGAPDRSAGRRKSGGYCLSLVGLCRWSEAFALVCIFRFDHPEGREFTPGGGRCLCTRAEDREDAAAFLADTDVGVFHFRIEVDRRSRLETNGRVNLRMELHLTLEHVIELFAAVPRERAIIRDVVQQDLRNERLKPLVEQIRGEEPFEIAAGVDERALAGLGNTASHSERKRGRLRNGDALASQELSQIRTERPPNALQPLETGRKLAIFDLRHRRQRDPDPLGQPGLALAVLTRFVLKEPRYLPQFRVDPATQESVRDTCRVLFAKASYRNIVWALIVYYLMAYGALIFTTPFIMRVHGLTVAEAGAMFGGVSAVGAVVGSVVGGSLADRLAKKDLAGFARLPGWGLIAAFPLYQAALLAPSATAMAAVLLVAGTLLAGVVPPMFAALHCVCGSSRRAMAVAIVFFFANLIGLGAGPVIAGMLSDHFALTHGPAEGLRYAMMVMMCAFLPSGYFMLRASRMMRTDAED